MIHRTRTDFTFAKPRQALGRDGIVGEHETVCDDTAAPAAPVPEIHVGSIWIREDDDLGQGYQTLRTASDPATVEADFEGAELEG